MIKFAAVLLLAAPLVASASQCADRFDRIPCSSSSAYTCPQKYRALAACQKAERSQMERDRAEKEKIRAAKEADERAAIAAINTANKRVKQTHSGPKERDPKNRSPTPAAQRHEGTSF